MLTESEVSEFSKPIEQRYTKGTSPCNLNVLAYIVFEFEESMSWQTKHLIKLERPMQSAGHTQVRGLTDNHVSDAANMSMFNIISFTDYSTPS